MSPKPAWSLKYKTVSWMSINILGISNIWLLIFMIFYNLLLISSLFQIYPFSTVVNHHLSTVKWQRCMANGNCFCSSNITFEMFPALLSYVKLAFLLCWCRDVGRWGYIFLWFIPLLFSSHILFCWFTF